MIDEAALGAAVGGPVADRTGAPIGVARRLIRSPQGQPLLLAVSTGAADGHEVVVPLQDVQRGSDGLRVVFDAATVAGAPLVAAGHELTDDEQGTVFDYFDGRAAGAPSGIDGTPAGLRP